MTNKKFTKKRKLKDSNETNSSGPATTASLHVESNVSTTTSLAATVDADTGNNSRGEIAGYIFMCNTRTKPDCFTYRVFGLPAAMIGVVEKIKPKTKLFLYDFEVKLLYGLYVSDSVGTLALEPHAFGGRYPAQVKFSIAKDCLPLPVIAFKDAIDHTGSKFKQELSIEQVNKLVSLFRPITLPPLHQPPLSFHGTAKSHYDVLGRPGYPHGHEVPYRGSHSAHSLIALARGSELASDPYKRYTSMRPHQAYYPEHLDVRQQDTRVRYEHRPQIALSRGIPPAPSQNSYYGQNERPPGVDSPPKPQAVTTPSALLSSPSTASYWVAMAANPDPSSTVKQSPSSVPGMSHDRSVYTEPGYSYQNYPTTVPRQNLIPRYIPRQGDPTLPHPPQTSGVSGYHQEVQKVNASETPSTYATTSYVNQEYPTTQMGVPEGTPTAGYSHTDLGYAGYYQPSAVTGDQGVPNDSGYYHSPPTSDQSATNSYPTHGYGNLPGSTSNGYYQAPPIPSGQGVANSVYSYTPENIPASSSINYVQSQTVPALSQVAPSGSAVAVDNTYSYHTQGY